MADGGRRVELLYDKEQRFFTTVERIYYTDECRELSKKLAALPERTASVRLTLAIEAAKVGGPY